MLEHEHLIVRALLTKPPQSEEYIIKWIKELVDTIGMKIALGPFAWYCDKEGNRGLTAMAIIETSHIALHCWDEDNPALLELDVYSCSNFETTDILGMLEEFEPVELTYMFLDRKYDLAITETGKK